MILWLLFFFALSAVFFFYHMMKKSLIKTLFFAIGWIGLFVFSAFRYDVGWDYSMYYALAGGKNYDAVGFLNYHYDRMGLVTQWMLDLADSMHCPTVFFVITTFIILACLTYACFKLSMWPEMSLMLCFALPHFYLDSFSTVRQWCAIALSSAALALFINEKKRPAAVLNAVAVFFHSSALLFFLIWFIPAKKLKRSYYIWLIVVCAVLKEFFLNFLLLGGGRFASYVSGKIGDGGTKIVFLYLIIFVLMWLFQKRLADFTKKDILLFNIAFVGVMLAVILNGYGHVAFRIPIYFFIAVIFLIPKYFGLIRFKSLSFMVLTAVCALLLIVSLAISNTPVKNPYIPYRILFWE